MQINLTKMAGNLHTQQSGRAGSLGGHGSLGWGKSRACGAPGILGIVILVASPGPEVKAQSTGSTRNAGNHSSRH